MATAAALKIPKTPGAAADMWWTLRQKRLAAQRVVDELQKQETALAEHLINTLPKSDATGVTGKLINVRVVTQTVPKVEDWDKLYKYIQKQSAKDPGVWSLLQRRVNDSTVKEIWEAGKAVPGVGSTSFVKLSYSQVS